MAAFKPENKLILMWKLGLPVIVSRTYSYKKTMVKLGMTKYLASYDGYSWASAISYHLSRNAIEIDELTLSVKSCLNIQYSKDVLNSLWVNVFNFIDSVDKN